MKATAARLVCAPLYYSLYSLTQTLSSPVLLFRLVHPEVLPTADHFTKFSLLLDTGEGGSNSNACTSSSQDNLFIWLSLGFVGTALCCICCAIFFIEICYFQKRKRRRRIEDSITAKRLQKSMGASSQGSV